MRLLRTANVAALGIVAAIIGLSAAASAASGPARLSARRVYGALTATKHHRAYVALRTAFGPAELHLRWKPFSFSKYAIEGDGRYLLLGAGGLADFPSFVIDGQTGNRIGFRKGCEPFSDGGDSLFSGPLFLTLSRDCRVPAAGGYDIDNVATGQVRAARCPSGGNDPCDYWAPDEMGAHWLEWSSYPPCNKDGCSPPVFVNFDTGQLVEGLPAITDTTVLDLDSPTLVRTVCPALSEPVHDVTPVFLPDGFGIVYQPVNAPNYGQNAGYFLVHCGSTMHTLVRLYLTSDRAVVWTADQRQYEGIDFATGRQFTFSLPGWLVPSSGPSGPVGALALASCRLYASTHRGRIWVATIPLATRGHGACH